MSYAVSLPSSSYFSASPRGEVITLIDGTLEIFGDESRDGKTSSVCLVLYVDASLVDVQGHSENWLLVSTILPSCEAIFSFPHHSRVHEQCAFPFHQVGA